MSSACPFLVAPWPYGSYGIKKEIGYFYGNQKSQIQYGDGYSLVGYGSKSVFCLLKKFLDLDFSSLEM
jgi:hypothetical protein